MSTLIQEARPSTPAGPPAKGNQPTRRRRRRNVLPYVLVLPALIAELFIHIIPMGLGIWIAFLSLNQLSIRNWINADFIGFTNFLNGLNPTTAIGSQFFGTLGRTAVYTVLVLGFSWALGTAAAYFLNARFRGRAVLRTLYLLPYALPVFVSAIAFAFMFNQRDGIINKILVDDLHLFADRPFWLIGSNAFVVLVIASIWTTWPFAFLLQLAALQTVPEDVYEAASLDGAGRIRQFFDVTLPMIRASNVVMLLLMFLATFNQFTVPFVLFGPSAPSESLLISPLIYQFSFGTWNFGLGGAVSTMLLVLLFVVSLIYIRLVMPKERIRRA
ncbi:carbohydrate ABC transporter permease [Agromyces albus]|uniref:carbohydrate ABC transporter permease n=1 Tax=Agromyces albus TaxID=205332 RepID=UPI001F51EFA4|nr:sugar ABC transporter permease [Agromyces albus]